MRKNSDRKTTYFSVYISYENQNSMAQCVDSSFSYLFDLKKNQYYSLKFQRRTFTCLYQNKKREFSYKQIIKVQTNPAGVILYLDDHACVTVAVDSSEKHNSELYDIVSFLKGRCRFRFDGKEPICYPEDENGGRYHGDQEPSARISFVLADAEIKRMALYDYFFGKSMFIYIICIVVFSAIGIVTGNMGMFIFVGIFLLLDLFLSKMFFDTRKEYARNHRGQLYMILYDDLLVVRLRDADLELKYASMKPGYGFFGLWHLKCGTFFTLSLPWRIVKDNPSFFRTLSEKIK